MSLQVSLLVLLISSLLKLSCHKVDYKKGCTRLATASDKVYQLLAHGQWFSPGTPASSTTKTGCHDIAEILLKVALSTINQSEISLTRPTLIHTFSLHFILKCRSQLRFC